VLSIKYYNTQTVVWGYGSVEWCTFCVQWGWNKEPSLWTGWKDSQWNGIIQRLLGRI